MKTENQTGGMRDTFLDDIPVEVVIELGRVRMTLRELAALDVSDVVELDQPISRPLSLVVGGKILAKGELILAEETLGFRITEIPEVPA